MSNILFLNVLTATTQENYNSPISDYKNWSRLLRIEYEKHNCLYADSHWDKAIDWKVKPFGYSIDNDILELNNLSLSKIMNDGKEITEVLNDFIEVIKDVKYIVGFNIDYHLNVIRSELKRNGYDDLQTNFVKICLMKIGTDICKIELNNKYKYPTFNELHKFVLNEDFYKENDFMCYTDSVVEIYKFFLNKNLLKEYKIKPYPKFKGIYEILFDNSKNNIEFILKENNNFDVYLKGKLLFNNIYSVHNYLKLGVFVLLYKTDDNSFINLIIDYNGLVLAELKNSYITLNHPDCDINGSPDFDIKSDYSNNTFTYIYKDYAEVCFNSFYYFAKIFPMKNGGLLYSFEYNRYHFNDFFHLYDNNNVLLLILKPDGELIFSNYEKKIDVLFFRIGYKFLDTAGSYGFIQVDNLEKIITFNAWDFKKKLPITFSYRFENFRVEKCLNYFAVVERNKKFGLYHFKREELILDFDFNKLTIIENKEVVNGEYTHSVLDEKENKIIGFRCND